MDFAHGTKLSMPVLRGVLMLVWEEGQLKAEYVLK
jgi:hypothetical protein